MDKRAIDILLNIIKKPSVYGYYELSKELNRTERTIRNDLDKINEFLEKYGLDTVKTDLNNKLYTTVNEEKVERIISKFTLFDYVPQKEERFILASILILSMNEFVTINDMAEFMAVSRSTIISVMDGVNRFLLENNIKLETQSGKGIIAIGEERDKRLLLIKLILKDSYLMRIYINQNNLLKYNKSFILDEDTMTKIRNLISLSESNLSISLTEKSFSILNLYISVVLSRLKKDCYVKDYTDVNNACPFADVLYKLMLRFFNLEYSHDEKNMFVYIVNYLNFDEKIINNSNMIKIQTLTRKFLENISDETGIDF